MLSVRSSAIVLALAACTAILYGYRLADAPPHLEIDEVLIGDNAHAIATTGRDLRGERLPLYSQTAEHSWYQPMVIYATALVLTIAPLAEWSVRVPAVGMGILDVVLMFFVAKRMFTSDGFGIAAAAFLALTPAHMIHARYAMDYHYPIAFVLAWLWCLLRFDASREPRWVLAAATVLGVGFYCYISSIVMMPLYLCITLAYVGARGASWRDRGRAIAVFAGALVPFAIWFVRHPSAFGATVEKYGVYDAHRLDAVQALRDSISYLNVGQYVSMYWRFLNPSVLFFTGGPRLMYATGLVGVFLLPVAALMGVGLYEAILRPRDGVNGVLLVGMLTAPIPAVLFAQEEAATFRALALVPFGVLLATLGLRLLWMARADARVRPWYAPAAVAAVAAAVGYAAWTLMTAGRVTRSALPLAGLGIAVLAVGAMLERTRSWRPIAVCVCLLALLQFRGFWVDYFGDYRVRASSWLGGNIRGALEAIVDADRQQAAPAIYFTPLRASSGQLDGRNQYLDAYWRFYTTKHARTDLVNRTHTLDADAATIPHGSLLLSNVGNPGLAASIASGSLKTVRTIPELDGADFFMVLRK
jgi:4-amino-4-deoxy-L-arabinose transferase-like glycosyltransferase